MESEAVEGERNQISTRILAEHQGGQQPTDDRSGGQTHVREQPGVETWSTRNLTEKWSMVWRPVPDAVAYNAIWTVEFSTLE